MMKWSFAMLLFLILVGCGSATNQEEEQAIVQEEVIRIYADTIGWDKKLSCKITYAGKEYKAKLKYRGGISSKYPKHSMTLELKKDVSFGGLPQNDDWILNASFIDKTFQRHKLSYDIFLLMDTQNRAPKCTYLPVYLNDQFKGLYVVTEKVNGSWLGFDKKNPDGARLFKDPFVFVKERLPNVQEPNNYYQQKFPKQKKLDCNKEPEAFKNFLFNSSDEDFIKLYHLWVAQRNVIDWHLLLLLTNNDDGVIKNFYLFKEPEGSQFQFVPWDYDHSFGRDGNYDLNLIEREVGWEKVILLRRLMELPETGYRTELKERYLELRESLFTEQKLFELLDENEAQIQPHLLGNAEVWPMDSKWYQDANDYDQEIEIIKQYIPMRLKQLDTFFSNLEYGEEEKE